MSDIKINKIHMGPAKCALDLGDGSERGEYVDQDYLLNSLGRPHRAISLMYCYYPKDPKWPARVSEAYKNDGTGAWGYPYDDYFTYKGGLNGTLDDEPFTYMRDVRRHGQDVLLTLTMDPLLEDEHIIAVARDLRKFGRVMLRINHEATGNWFSFNKRASYEEVAAFFVRCCDIIHKEAKNVKVILCLDGYKTLEEEKNTQNKKNLKQKKKKWTKKISLPKPSRQAISNRSTDILLFTGAGPMMSRLKEAIHSHATVSIPYMPAQREAITDMSR